MYVMGLGQGGGEMHRRKTILNSGCLVMVEICVIFSFSFFSVFQKTQRREVVGYNG